ncbi:MAG: L,D-transpeptidase [Deltaproteobacteria bacterium]|nr:L,D-transpeptidase [Deltaproteobacteria bacterium]
MRVSKIILGTWILVCGFLASSAQAKEDYSELWKKLGLEIKEPVKIKINLPAARLDFYIKDELVKSYGVAIGSYKHQTPIRNFTMPYIYWNPWWYPPKDSEWAEKEEDTPPGPGNPLGLVKMKMQQGIMIHGTTSPWSIGRAASHGCFRMKNYQAKELAWEIQQRYSEKNDPELLSVYQRNQKTTYYVPLLEAVPVEVSYHQVERFPDRLLLHPNLYWRKGFEQDLKDALADQEDLLIDKVFIKKMDRLRLRHTVEVSLDEVHEWAGSTCREESLGS